MTDATDRLAAGLEAHRNGDLATAERLYREVLAADPRQPDALHLLARIAMEAEQFGAALDLVKHAIAVAAPNAAYLFTLGQIEQARGDHGAAAAAYAAALDIDADIPEAHNNLGNALRAIGRADEAIDALKRAIALNPDFFEAHHNLGNAYRAAGHTDSAIASFRTALGLVPGDAETLFDLAHVLAATGRKDEARDAIDAAVTACPEDTGFRLARADMLIATNRPDAAAADLAFVRQSGHDGVDLRLLEGRLALIDGDRPAAAEKFAALIADVPDCAAAHHNLGTVRHGAGDLSAAAGHYLDALSFEPDLADSHLQLGNLLTEMTRSGRSQDAVTLAQRWQAAHPEHPTVRQIAAAILDTVPPDMADEAHLRTTFDRFADDYEQRLDDLAYQLPDILRLRLNRLYGPPERRLQVLDAGCGTGLLGPAIAPYAADLTGIDLSPAMLAHARSKKLYDRLETAELTEFLAAHPDRFDLIVCADVFCYFGALDTVFGAVAGALRQDGALIATVERLDERAAADWQAMPEGRYRHAEDYIRRTVNTAALIPEHLAPDVLRTEAGRKVAGLVAVIRKTRPPMRPGERPQVAWSDPGITP